LRNRGGGGVLRNRKIHPQSQIANLNPQPPAQGEAVVGGEGNFDQRKDGKKIVGKRLAVTGRTSVGCVTRIWPLAGRIATEQRPD